MTMQNTTNTLTQKVILSAAFNHLSPSSTNTSSKPSSNPTSPTHWQDKIEDSIMNLNTGNVGNEYELDVESLTHMWQTSATALPMPGMANVLGGDGSDHNSAQIVAISLDLGMMREMITIQGVLIDREIHPSSTSGHHIRRQHLLDIARTQWANVHGWNRENKFDWNNPNKFPALTIGPMYGRTTSGSDRDDGYYGQEPWSDIRGGSSSFGCGINFDFLPNYKGRRRYRGLIRRLTLTQVPSQPDVWRFQFDFEVVKNELEQRMLVSNQSA